MGSISINAEALALIRAALEQDRACELACYARYVNLRREFIMDWLGHHDAWLAVPKCRSCGNPEFELRLRERLCDDCYLAANETGVDFLPHPRIGVAYDGHDGVRRCVTGLWWTNPSEEPDVKYVTWDATAERWIERPCAASAYFFRTYCMGSIPWTLPECDG